MQQSQDTDVFGQQWSRALAQRNKLHQHLDTKIIYDLGFIDSQRNIKYYKTSP